ncbi:MAG: hypothetical protein GY862_09660 [Gammaproteobacteria bacterium]|nr:hypothetical protein [Gammaproteobacteria bacterium]
MPLGFNVSFLISSKIVFFAFLYAPTYTPAHGDQPNDLTSALSEEVSAQTDSADPSDTPRAEREALVALYNSTDGPNWSDAGRNNWNQDNSPCDWTGVACSAGNVIIVDRFYNNLVGTLPDLNALTSLQQLNLSSNGLTGAIPGLSALANLQEFHLGFNGLTGAIPDPSALTNLQGLYLHGNQLTDEIPDLSALTNLKYLSLYDNQLTGAIPDLGALTNLRWLSLFSNHLTGGIPDLSTLTNLQYFFFNNNQLSGAIPDLSALTNLRCLYLNNNRLSGDIPPSLAVLPNLTSLYIGYNMLTASDPALVAWLNENYPTWADTQTVPPEMIGAAWQSSTSVQVTWTPIPYTGHGGFYRVYYSTTPGGPYTEAGATADKIEDNYIASGLQAETLYYFVVETYTPAHGDQQNDLTSALSEEVSAGTSGPRVISTRTE